MAVAEPTAVGVRPMDRQGSLVARPSLRTRALDDLEANGGARSRGCAGTAALHARRRRVGPTTVATISHLWRNGASPLGARRPLPTRRAQVFDRVWKQRTGSKVFDPDRIVSFLLSHAEFSSQFTFATFPSPHFPRVTATLPQPGIVLSQAPPA